MVGFAEEVRVNRKRLFAGLALLAVFVALAIPASTALLREWSNRQATTGHRQPLRELSYCTPERPRPCFLSFNVDRSGEMLVTLQTEHSVPDFYLQVSDQKELTTYQCHMVGRISTTVLCTGKTVPVGEVLQFLLISKADRSLLAEGQFPIIGLALATPEPATTPTTIPIWDRPPR